MKNDFDNFTKEERRERFKKYVSICERAEKSNPSLKKCRMSNMMDIESADIHFHMRLDDWLNAENLDFFHDFYGITQESNRESFPATFGLFVPRFEGKSHYEAK